MVGKNNKQIKNTKQGTKVESYSIKKFKVGAASVVIGASIFFGAGVAAAADTQENSVDTNSTSEKTDAAASEEAPQAVAQPVTENKEVAKEATTEEVAKAVEEKVTTTNEVKVDATELTNFIKELEQHIEDGTYDNRTEDSIKALKEEIAKAKITAETSKDQATIDATLEKLTKLANELPTKEVKEEAKAETTEATEAKAEEATEAKEETVAEAKEELQHIVTEAPLVTNSVAKEAEKVEDSSAKAAITTAIETVNTKVAEAVDVIKNDQATKDDVKTKTSELRSALEAVAVARTNAGITGAVSAQLDDSASTTTAVRNPESYYADQTPNPDGTRNVHFETVDKDNHTGADIYKFDKDGKVTSDGANRAGEVNNYTKVTNPTGGTASAEGLEIEIYSNQRTGTETNPNNGISTANGGKEGHNNMGRMDYPLTAEMAKKLAQEAPFWNGKLKPSGSKVFSGNASIYSNGGGYEFLATEIYKLAYEQGIDRVYIPDISKRFGVTADSAAKGWEFTSIDGKVGRATDFNLPTGLTYDATNDTIQGVITNGNENGVQDFQVNVTYTNKNTGAVVTTRFVNMRMGWVGWMDTTPPKFTVDGNKYNYTVGDTPTTTYTTINTATGISKDGVTSTTSTKTVDGIDIGYRDASAARTITSGGANVGFVNAEDKTITIRQTYVGATTGVAGTNLLSTNKGGTVADTTVPGLTYSNSSTSQYDEANGYVTTNGVSNLKGTLTEAGIYTVSLYGKDYNRTSAPTDANDNWGAYSGQETHASITVVVAPKVVVKNIETYSTEIPVNISKGATSATVTLPDGETVIGLVAKDVNGTRQWVVDSVTGNTTMKVGDNLGDVTSDKDITIKVTPAATANAGVDNIKVTAVSENVVGTFLRQKVTLNTSEAGKTVVATLNSETGQWELPTDYADVTVTTDDGGKKYTHRQVYTEAQEDGSQNFYIYEYTRTTNAAGEVTNIDTPTRPETKLASMNATSADGMSVRVTFDKNADGTFTTTAGQTLKGKWTSSDGTAVTITEIKDKDGQDAWQVETASGFGGLIRGVSASNTDVATIINTKPTAESTSYESTLNKEVNLIDRPKADTAVVTDAKVSIKDTEDDDLAASDASDDFKAAHKTKVTSITVKDPDGNTVFADVKTGNADNYPDATTLKLTKVGVYTVTVNVLDSNTNYVNATLGGTDSGKDAGVNSSTATTTYTITVKQNIEGTPKTSSDIQGQVQTEQPTFTFNDTDKTAIDQGTKVYTLDGADTEGKVEVKDAAGKRQGTYTINKDSGVVTFTPEKDYVGTPTAATVKLTVTFGNDTQNNPITAEATATYTPTVVPVTPTAEASKTSGPQGKAQTSAIKFDAADTDDTTVNFAKGTVAIDATTTKSVDLDKSTVTLLDAEGKETTTVTVAGQGTYTLDKATNTITFQPLADFVGTATAVNVQVKDANGTVAKTTYTPTVTPVTAEGTPKTSTDVQGAVQTGTPTFTVSDETNIVKGTDGKPAATYALKGADAEGKVEVKDGDKVLYTYTINPTTGEVTFTPAKDYKGQPTAATVVATYTLETEDKADTTTTPITAEATYTPTIVPVVPTATESSTTGIQGEVQKSEVVLDNADTNVNTLNFAKGSTDVNGGTKSVDLDPTTLSLVGADNDGKVTIAGQGTYSITTEGGKSYVVFTPEKSYTGDVTPVTVSLKDKNGTEVTTTYTPKIVGVKPIADASKTTGVQGLPQTSNIVYDAANNSDNDATTLNFAAGSATVNDKLETVALDKKTVQFVDASGKAVDTLTVANEGTYTLVKDDQGNVRGVKFQPVATFTGEATPVNVQIKDANGTVATTTYTPSVTPVTASAEPATSTGTQGTTQSGTPTYTAPTVDASLKVTPKYELEGADKDGKVVVPNVGTYSIDKDGKVTFSPVASYTGTPEGVKVKVTYSISTGVEGETPATVSAETTYTPTVNPVTSEGNKVETTNVQGQEQKSTDDNKSLTYTISDASHITKRTYAFEDGTTTKTVANVGTYTVDDKGQVTFVPVATYTGTADVVTVVETATLTADDNSTTTITTKSTYQPTVTPVTIKSENAQSTNVQGMTQTGTPTFTSDNKKVTFKEYKLVDPTTGKPTEDTSVTTTEGTYTIDKATGKVTFVPKPDFVGKGSITVEATDSLGRTITANYTPQTTPITVESTDATSKDIQGKTNPQEGTPKFTLPTDIENTEVKEGTKLAEVTGYTLLDDKGTPVNELNKPEGKYEIDVNGKVTFTPVNSYTGTPSPVKVQATVTITNANGEKATITKEANYTPTVVPVTPTAQESATAGKQGAKQVSPIVFDNTDTNTTTLNFNKGETSEVLGKDGKAKSVELVKDSVTLLDANGNPTTTVTVAGQGTYTLVKDSEGNYSIEFQPTPEYSGTATPVRVQATDLNGSVVETTYTPTVIAEDGSVVVEYIDKDTNLPIVPTETPVNNAKVTTDYTTTPKEIPGYKLVEVKNPTGTTKDENGKVTGKVTDGTTTITYVYERIKQKATLSYFDITTGKEVAIASAPSESVEGVTNTAIDFTNKAATIAALEKAGYEVTTDEFQAATTANRLFDNDENVDQNFKVLVKQRVLPVTPTTPNVTPGVPVTPEDPANWPESVKDLQKQLTKTVTRTIKYRYIDENGQEAAKDVVQTVTFTRNATVNLVTGEVVFGDWSAAQTLSAVNSPAIDGYTTTTTTVASATVTFESTDSTVYVIYNKVAEKTTSYVDGSGKEISPKEDGTKEAKKVPGYYYTGKTTVDKDGNITHVYAQVTTKFIEEGTNKEVAPEQKGTQPKENVEGYEYVRTVTDENGNTTHIYKKVVKPETETVTKFVEKGTNKELAPSEKGKQNPKVIDGYKLVGTEVDPNGNVTHIYEKVQTPETEKVTKFVDENGNPVANEEKGKQNPKEVPGYEFVRTYTDESGNTVHVYKKVTNPVTEKVTKFVDENGNPVANEEKGNQPKKEVPGYEFVRTYTDESGNTVHVYKKVTNPTPTPTVDKTTSFVDENGNPIRPTEEGTQPKKDIPGYEFVETKVDEKGNTVHVYRKVTNPTPVNPVTPEQPSKPETPAKPATVKEGKQLPNTDASTNNAANAAAGAGLIALIAAAVRRRKNK